MLDGLTLFRSADSWFIRMMSTKVTNQFLHWRCHQRRITKRLEKRRSLDHEKYLIRCKPNSTSNYMVIQTLSNPQNFKFLKGIGNTFAENGNGIIFNHTFAWKRKLDEIQIVPRSLAASGVMAKVDRPRCICKLHSRSASAYLTRRVMESALNALKKKCLAVCEIAEGRFECPFAIPLNCVQHTITRLGNC